MAQYDNNIVNGPDLLSESQGPMQQNFQALADLVAVNHYPFGDPNEGKHTFLTMPVNTRPQLTNTTEIIAFDIQSTFTNRPELTYIESGGLPFRWLLSAGNVPLNQPSWSCLSGKGLVVKTGTALVIQGPYRLVFRTNPAIPDFSAIFTVQLAIYSPGTTAINGSVYVTDFDELGINVQVYSNVAGNLNPFGVFIVAIGSIDPL